MGTKAPCRPKQVRDINGTSISTKRQSLNFDRLAENALGIYVYALVDPRDKMPFYIGKAGGSGQGNARPDDHFSQALEQLCKTPESGRPNLSEKTKRIVEIWQRPNESEVDLRVIRRGIPSEKEALRLEGALIDVLREFLPSCLLNKQSGHGAREEGLLSPEEVRALNAPKFSPEDVPTHARNKTVFLFNVAKGLKRIHPAKAEIYEATRKAWRLGADFRSQPGSYAVGLVGGVSMGAYAIDRWEPMDGRWGFIASKISDDVQQALIHKNYQEIIGNVGGWTRGVFGAFKIATNGRIEITRGQRNQSTP